MLCFRGRAMNSSILDHRSRDGRSPTNLYLLRNPLEFISEAHLRLRTMCTELDRLSWTETPEPDATASLIGYLLNELPLLLADEHENLVPYTLRRAEPEDEFPKFAKRLHNEHVRISDRLEVVTPALASLEPEEVIPESLRIAMRDLANETRRHVILENAILLPLARARLSEADLGRLRTAMLGRRGIENRLQDQLQDTRPCAQEPKP